MSLGWKSFQMEVIVCTAVIYGPLFYYLHPL